MKKLLFALLFVSTAFIMADQPVALSPRHNHGTGPIETVMTDGVVFSQPYRWELLYNGLSNYSGGNRWICDDFELIDNYYVTGIRVWMIWTGEQATQMNLIISEDYLLDWNPNTNKRIWEECVPCTNLLTGDSNWGYDIYETYCTISADVYPELDADVHYYFETQAETCDNCFILVSVCFIDDCCWYDDGSGEWVRCDNCFCPEPDLFFDFYGEPLSSLQPETWGSIKTLF